MFSLDTEPILILNRSVTISEWPLITLICWLKNCIKVKLFIHQKIQTDISLINVRDYFLLLKLETIIYPDK